MEKKYPIRIILPAGFPFRRCLKAAAFIVVGIIVCLCIYSSLEEAFFFKHADTRIIAHEWVCRNVLQCFKVSGSIYSIKDPYVKYKGKRDRGEFFVSSYPERMPIPKDGVQVKEFSLENKIFPVIHRNPTLRVFAIPGKDIKKGFSLPAFAHASAKEAGTGFVFLNGVDFGVDPLQFQIKRGRKLILVSWEPVREIAVLLTNNFSPTDVKIKTGWKMMRVKLAPYETKMVMFENPPRGFPFTKYFYKFSISKKWDNSQVFVRVGAGSLRIGRMYCDIGSYGKASKYLKKAHAGEDPWTEEFTGLSKKYLRGINKMSFISESFSSHRGWETKVEGKMCVATECGEGEEDCIYGPYYGFPRGKFVARYNLKITGVTGTSKIKLDVTGRLGTKIISQTFLKPEDTGGFVNVELPFCIETPAEILEFRITLKSSGKIFLNKVDVFPDIKE